MVRVTGVYVYAGEWARTTFKLSQIGVVAVYFVVAAGTTKSHTHAQFTHKGHTHSHSLSLTAGVRTCPASVHAAIQVANYKIDGGSVSDSTMLLEEYMIDWIIANGQQAG